MAILLWILSFTNTAEFIAVEGYVVIWSSLSHNFGIKSATGTCTLLCNIFSGTSAPADFRGVKMYLDPGNSAIRPHNLLMLSQKGMSNFCNWEIHQ